MHYILAALFANPKFIFSRIPLIYIYNMYIGTPSTLFVQSTLSKLATLSTQLTDGLLRTGCSAVSTLTAAGWRPTSGATSAASPGAPPPPGSEAGPRTSRGPAAAARGCAGAGRASRAR